MFREERRHVDDPVHRELVDGDREHRALEPDEIAVLGVHLDLQW